MAKRHALLIGISRYGEGLPPIPSALLDVEKMAEVLLDPELGGIEAQNLQVLKDPGRMELASAIESFYADKQTDDLLLFYFSGHGFRDEDRQLLLSSAETKKVTHDGKSRVQRSTTLTAAEVQGFMERSRSRRQVVILDCCFSGAFAEGLTVNKGEGPIEIEEMLGGKGRAVLTSSDAIETSRAPEAGDGLSVYTRFLVEGIQTGAADRQGRGWLDAEDLHLYAERRVHEIAPAMTPQFFPTREGHSIQVCRVRREPSVAYRQKVQELAESRRGKISPAGREILTDLSAELGLTAETTGQIEAEVLQPFCDYAGKLERYQSAAKATLEAGGSQANGLSSQDRLELKEVEQRLKLRAADVAAIHNKLGIKEEGQAEDLRRVLSAPADATGASQEPQSAVQATNPTEYDELQHQTECVEEKNSKIFAEKRSDSSVDARLIAEYNLCSSSEYAISVICARPATWSFSVYDTLGVLSSQFHQQIDCTLLDGLVSDSIGNPTFNDGLSRTLLTRFIPKELKKYFFQSNQIVLLLDDITTCFPWELVGGSPTPFALGTLLIRLPQTSPLPKQARQATSRSAYVIGNPSSAGFFNVFVGEGPKGSTGLASLDGARMEAEKVLTLLADSYSCQCSIEEENGVDVINKLYQQPYRVLHIAGHGIYEHPTRQGDRRSGVVLSGGILITAAEIEAMEVVPDLVFLNCCHLGTVKREPVAFNRLAASVARQLIEMGVRAVVACGWAVDDQAALVFAEVFYTAMLNGRRFGEAVFLARKEAHAAVPASNTWGAYQAYGDPAYQLETSDTAPVDGSGPSPEDLARWTPVTCMELIDRLKQLEVRIGHGDSHEGAADSLQEELRRLLDSVPPSWLGSAEVAVAVADVYAAFGGALWEEACRHYLAAIRSHQGSDGLPIRAMEQLANLDARLGERNNDEARVEKGIERLKALIQIVSSATKEATGEQAAGPPGEWQSLLGSAYKRLAALRARALSRSAQPMGKKGLDSVMEPLNASIEAYSLASDQGVANQLNRLALEAVRGLSEPTNSEAIQEAQTLVEELRSTLPRDHSFWSRVAVADALLARGLLDRRLAAEGPSGDAAAKEIEEAYLDVFANVRNTPLERESVHEHLSLLGDLVRARSQCRSDPCPHGPGLAARLQAIGAALQRWEETMGANRPGPPDSKGGEDDMESLS